MDQPPTNLFRWAKGAVIGIIGMFLAMMGFVWIGGYVHSVGIEARRPLYEYQLDTFRQTARAVSAIVTTKDPSKREEAVRQFHSLDRGEMRLIDNAAVREKMAAFRAGIEMQSPRLEEQGQELLAAMKQGLMANWQIGSGRRGRNDGF